MIPSSLYCHACGAENATDRSVCFACKQPLQDTQSDNIALLQGRYRILTQVGKGGFGAVYRVEDIQQSGNIVAIKQINLRGLTPQETIEATDAFNREVSLLSHLSHPNLPRIYDNFTDPEHWYLVMDFIEGETLESYLDAKGANYTASLNEVLTLGLQLCTVLDYLHTREPVIIFRDLKPANIMRTPDNKLYLIDFGIARSFKPGKLKDTIPFGSPGYAAPEQYGKAQTTPRADIYSLGALLHMLLSGDDPVDNPFHFSPLRIYGVSGLTELEALLVSMVQLDANKRPATVTEVKDELQRITDLQDSPRLWRPPVGQTPPALPIISSGNGQQQISISGSGQQQLYMPQVQRARLARRKFIIGGFSIAGLTIIGAGGIANIVSALHSSTNTGPENSIGAASSFNNDSLFGPQYTYQGHTQPVRSIAWSIDENFIASASDDGTIQVWTVQKVLGRDSNLSSPVYTYKADSVQELAWGQGSLSENIIAFNQNRQVRLWDTSQPSKTAIPLSFATDKAIANNVFAWSPDGTRIVCPTSTGIQIWDIAQMDVVKHIDFAMVKMSAGESIASLSWSSNGKYIAVGLLNSNETVILDVLSPKQPIYTTIADVGSYGVMWSPNGTYLAIIDNDTVNIAFPAGNSFEFVRYQLPAIVTALAWSSDSKYVVTANRGYSAFIHIWSPFKYSTGSFPSTSGTPVVDDSSTFVTDIDTKGEDIHSLAWSSDGSFIAVGANRAYLLEVNIAMLNSQGS